MTGFAAKVWGRVFLEVGIVVGWFFVVEPVVGRDCVWTGTVSESFSEAGNWAGFEVPTALDTVVHSNSAGGAFGGHSRIRVDMDAEIDSLVVIGGGGRSLVIDDDCSLVVRKGITNRVSAEYPVTVREIGNLFVGGEVGANVSINRMRDRVPVDLILQRAIERQAMLTARKAEPLAAGEGRMVAASEAEIDAVWPGTIDDAGATSANRKLDEGVKYIGGVPEGGDGVADVFYIDRPGGKRVKATVIARTGDPAPGLPGTFFGMLGTPAMRSDGEQALVYALLVGSINGDSLWRWTRGEGLELVAHVGQQAAGMAPGVVYTWLSRRHIDNSGAVAFAGMLTGPGIVPGFNDDAVWYGQPDDLQLVLQGGMHVPGSEPEVIIDSVFPIQVWSMSRDGNLILWQDVVDSRYEDAWALLKSRQGRPLETVAVTGQPVAALPGAEVLLATDGRAALGDNGVAFRFTVMGIGFDDSNDSGTWLNQFGVLSPFQHEGQPAPGMDDEAITVRTGNVFPQINGLGHSVHPFRIQGPGIDATNEWTMAGLDIADFSIFFQQGDPSFLSPPDTLVGLPFSSFVDLNDHVTFLSTLTGPEVDMTNNRIFYSSSVDDFSILIRSGDPVPIGIDAGIFSLQPASTSAKIARNENGEMAISAFYQELPSKEFFEAVWQYEFETDEWTLLFRERDNWDGAAAPATDGAYFDFNSGTGGEPIGFADDGTLGIHMEFPNFDDRIYTVNVIHIGDADEDGDVDLVDFAAFQICFTGPEIEATESCGIAFDSDGDQDVDLIDFAGFQLQFTGPF